MQTPENLLKDLAVANTTSRKLKRPKFKIKRKLPHLHDDIAEHNASRGVDPIAIRILVDRALLPKYNDLCDEDDWARDQREFDDHY